MDKKTLEKYWVDISKILGSGIDILAGNSAASMTAKVLAIGAEVTKEDGVEKGLPVILGVPLAPNPHFLENGYSGQSFKFTAPYLRQRCAKKIGGEAFEIAGGVASACSGALSVNVASAIKHGTADASSLIHLYRFANMSVRVQGSEYLSFLLDILIRMKMTKVVVRSGDFAGSLAGGIFGKVISMTMRGCKIGIKEQAGAVVAFTAQELHWRAYVEQRLLGHFGGGTGPASLMVKELLTRRTHRLLGGQYDWKGIVNEPAGWIVLKDKIAMI
ncbi:hypothetical protein [Hahella ganghwensis]|uniref:hypothetical protein n=1 Tax=Hahella ganghwensis TaxID=286420 RepID=UPI0003811C3B|nr:hypothetical protein [Hahella ganghwensis]